MSSPVTLIELIEFQANNQGGALAFTWKGRAVTYLELFLQINRFAASLLPVGLEVAEPVIVSLPNNDEFLYAFYGVQRAGGVPVPVSHRSGSDRIASIGRSCGARIVVLPQDSLYKNKLQEKGFICLDLNSILPVPRLPAYPNIHAADTAYLQFTSGSTGDPKAVMLSHENLLTNIKQMVSGMQITKRDIFVSWLPLFHDMGLILMSMVPMYMGDPVHLLPPNLKNIELWFDAIQRYKGTFTAGPDFAYRFCVKHLARLVKYDVSSLRVALNAAEPVRQSTIADFESSFGLHNVMTAGYGLAEATVGVSMSTPSQPVIVDENGIVSVGMAFEDVDIRIDQSSEILVKSPATTRGYHQNIKATKDLYTDGGFINTGDLGYLDKMGNLFVTGRKKNIIKHAGELVSPQEIEETVNSLSGVQNTAAIGIDQGRLEGEQVYIFAEVVPKFGDPTLAKELVIQIVEAFHDRLGFRPARVILIRRGVIPRTENGKVQYSSLKQSYRSGALYEEGGILYQI